MVGRDSHDYYGDSVPAKPDTAQSQPSFIRKGDAGSPVAVPAFKIGSGRLPNGFSQIESL